MGMGICTFTGISLCLPGLNMVFIMASIAASSNPAPIPFNISAL